MMASRPAFIDLDDARLVVQATREAARQPRARVRPAPPPRPLSPNKVVKTTAMIKPASAANAPGSGPATLQVFNGATFDDLGVAVTIYNLTSATIAANAYVQVVVVDGYFFYDVTDCKNGS